MEQPFDDYKNKGVEYDYILSASVKIGIVDNIIPNLINLLKDEDFLNNDNLNSIDSSSDEDN